MPIPIKQLKDSEGNKFYPQTVKSAIPDWDAPKVTITDVDPGEGTTMGSNELIGVYGNSGLVQTDDIANGAVTSEKLNVSSSNKLIFGNTAIVWGTTHITGIPTGAGTEKSVTIPYGTTFVSNPTITLTVTDLNGAVGEYTIIGGVTTTNFIAWIGHIRETSSTSCDLHWQVIGKVA